ncbi:hypothetical protein [Allonocardiopsis opalescens]|uniref:Uncharacterized protein n=1 Tax=Allonocardiopsis opalescens TaxID=1144618 RepID=A0A2T0Q7C3_9ACTN|nr:hypothetical protein [Allonocardiopsis opalescens]PRX99735.1 hypothetical protein CLV72_103340 [Allonocardiopsis opalescens]
MTGASTIVTAMATQAWTSVQGRVLRLFGRDPQARPAVQARLDGDNGLVTRASEPDVAREQLVAGWRPRLEDLLAEHPDLDRAEAFAPAAAVAEPDHDEGIARRWEFTLSLIEEEVAGRRRMADEDPERTRRTWSSPWSNSAPCSLRRGRRSGPSRRPARPSPSSGAWPRPTRTSGATT